MGKQIKNKERISSMFDDIASEYDAANHFLSMGVDRIWRKKIRKMIARSQNPAIQILDLATGTGDLALALAKIPGSEIVGLDIADKMLDCARAKAAKKGRKNIRLIQGDALNIPFPEATFDVVTIAFGIRNFEDVTAGVREINRVLKPGGKYYIIELTRPNKYFRPLYNIYLNHLLPVIGSIITRKKSAYLYLKDTISDFLQDDDLNVYFEQNGFEECSFYHWSFGIATLYTGSKVRIEKPIDCHNADIDNNICEVTFHAN
jgi:demethylmenaquinone methyltransferase / 2-methoxy-6-polyprenyl-1,4-benzoquinol methylase